MVKFQGGFDVINRGDSRPPTTFEVLVGSGFGIINIAFQVYLVYGGGSTAFCNLIGYTNTIEVSDTQKAILLVLFVENQLHADLRNMFVFQSAVWSGCVNAAFIQIFVRGFFFSVMSLTAPLGYGLMPVWIYVVGLCWMLFFQWVELRGDDDLKTFIKKKRAGSTNTKRVCNEGLWSISRHPNHLGFVNWWAGHALVATSNPATVLYFYVALHLWILILGIPSNERYMTSAYGDEYLTYKSTVPMLYPIKICAARERCELAEHLYVPIEA